MQSLEQESTSQQALSRRTSVSVSFLGCTLQSSWMDSTIQVIVERCEGNLAKLKNRH